MSDVTADTPPPFERAGRDAGAVGGSDVARGSSGADGDERSARGVSGAVAPARARRPRLAGPWVKPTVFLVSLAPFVALADRAADVPFEGPRARAPLAVSSRA